MAEQCVYHSAPNRSAIFPYASEDERAKHAQEYPKDKIPPKEKPNSNRDWRLPKGPF